LQILETHGPSLSKLKDKTQARDAKRLLLEEQDEEFHKALEIDKEKARLLKEEQDKMEEETRRMEAERELILANKKATREELTKKLPPEPQPNDSQATVVAIRMLDGSKLSRRFLRSDTLQTVMHFVQSRQPVEVEQQPQFDLVSNFPRKLFTDLSVTLQQAGLFPQALLFVSERQQSST